MSRFSFFSWRGIRIFLTASTKIPSVERVSQVRWCLNESRNDLSEGQVGFYLRRFIKCSSLFTTKPISSQKQKRGVGRGSTTRANASRWWEAALRPPGSCWLSWMRVHSAVGVSRSLSPPDSLSLAPFPGICPPAGGQDCGLCLPVRIWHPRSLFYGDIILSFFQATLCPHKILSCLPGLISEWKTYSQLWENLKA